MLAACAAHYLEVLVPYLHVSCCRSPRCGGKTVLGAGFYATSDKQRVAAAAAAAQAAFHAAGIQLATPATANKAAVAGIVIETDGLVFLGQPLGSDGAALPVGGGTYRTDKTEGFIKQHDHRLRQVIALSHRDERSYSALVRLSVQLAHLLLRWS